MKGCIYNNRIPEPIRIADQKSRELVKKYYDGYKKKQNFNGKNKYDYGSEREKHQMIKYGGFI